MGKQVKGWVPPDEEIMETTEPVAKTEWIPPDDEIIEPAKKKEESISVSSSDSTEPGKPQKKSSQKNTPQNKWQSFSDAARSIHPLVGAAVDMGRKIASGFTDELPQAIVQSVEVAKSTVNPASSKEFVQRVPVDFQNYVREKEGLSWYQPFDMDKYIDKYADQFMQDTGREDITKNIAANRPEIIARRQEVEKYVQKQKAEGAEKMAGAVQSYKDIHNLTDFASYIGTLGGNAAYQIPLAILTKGGSSLLQESATIYDQQLDNIAKEKGLSREEVIANNLDRPAEGQAYAVLAATLDKVSAGNILSAFKAGGGQMVKKWVRSAVPEAVTEPVQGVLEDVGAGGELGEALTSSKRIDELAGGLVGGSVGAVGPTEAINEARQNVDVTDQQSVEAAAQNIEQALNTEENAVSEQKLAEIPVRSTPGDSQTLEEGVSRPEPEKTTRESENKTQEIIDEQQSKDADLQTDSGSTTQNPKSAIAGGAPKTTIQPESPSEKIEGDTQPQITDEQKVVWFTTSKGSSYEVDGIRTIRTKAYRQEHGVEDQGKKDPSQETVYLSSDNADKAQIVYASGQKNRTISKEGNEIVIRDEMHNGRKQETRIPFTNKPEIGLHPFEVWRGGKNVHLGNKITEIKYQESPSKPQSDEQTPTPEQQGQQPDGPVEQPTVGEEQRAADQPQAGGEVAGKTYAIAQRILDSDANEAIKRGVKAKGAEYIPKKITITDSEAKNLIDLYGEDKSESLIRDTKNDLTGDTRTALAARLYEQYKAKADESTDQNTKQVYYDKAVDIALTSAEQLKEAGRQSNAAKIWKAITSNEDMTVMAIEKENQRQSQKLIKPIETQVVEAKQQFDEQVRRIISQKVQEGVESRLKRAKLITSEKKKQINDAFDKLKVKDTKGTANDIIRVIGANVWNGSVEAVKRAVLAGADLANAIQAGVDYVRDNYKGTWDEDQYKSAISPAVEQMVPHETVEREQIDEKQIKTPKLSGKRKKDFINQVIDAFNQNRLTDEKFDQLYAKQLGAVELSSDDRAKIRELAKTISEVEKFEEQVKNDFTKENISKYKSLLDKAQKANAELQQYAQKPSNVWDTLISIMQGNLLTSMSLVTNIYSNTALQSLRFMSTGIGSVVDYSVSKLAKAGILSRAYKDPSFDLVELQKGYFEGAWNGLVEGAKQLISGPKADERSLREINNQFSPLRAVARWADGNRTLEQKANDYVEGTIGWPAEVFFRLLNLGDKPFRRAAEMARAMEIAKKKQLKGKEAEKFIMFPDESSAELIKQAGDDATFQQESASSKFVQEILAKLIDTIGKTPYVGGPLKVLAKSQIPYVKTPWNITVETLKYAAFPVTGAVGIHQMAKGNKRSGSVMLGQAIVGAMIFGVAKELFIKGLLSWDEPYEQKSGKQRERRQIQYDNIPPNSLNVSAIQRGLLDGDWSIKDNDTWIDYNKLGVIGSLFDNYSNNYFSNIRDDEEMPENSEFYVDMLTTAPRVLSQSLDQSFLKGTNTFLTALQDGGGYETEQWLINTTGALTSIVYPNTLSTLSKSSDEFIRDTRDDNFAERLKNTYKTKFFIGEQLPPKVNLWGDKITGNPEGRNKYAYYLWDPTKFKNVDTDGWKYKLYQEWKNSMFEDDYLPSIPRRDLTYRKVKIRLNSVQYEQLATYVGEERKNLASTYINSAGFERKDKEKVIKKLKDLYSEGAERGKERFLRNNGWNVLTPEKLSQIGKTD